MKFESQVKKFRQIPKIILWVLLFCHLILFWSLSLLAQEQRESRPDLFRSVLVDPTTGESAPESPIRDNGALELRSRVRSGLETFSLGIMELINGAPFTAHQFLGFSGASFQDIHQFESDFSSVVIDLSNQTQIKYGPQAKTILILGGTVDGFGKGYEIIESLRREGTLTNIHVVGMVSDKAVDYHLDGIKKGWGDVISPLQEIFFLKETFTDSEGNRSWELKDSVNDESDTAKVLKYLSNFTNNQVVSFNVFGGGVQAFNESLELILESRNRSNLTFLNLHIGYLPGKPKKDTGYRASDMLAYLIAAIPDLVPDHLKVQIYYRSQAMTIDDYRQSDFFNEMKKDFERAQEQIDQYAAAESLTDDEQAQKRYFEALTKIKDLAQLELEKFKIRSSENLARLRAAIQLPDREAFDAISVRNAMDQIPFCVACDQDAKTIYERFETCWRLVNHGQ